MLRFLPLRPLAPLLPKMLLPVRHHKIAVNSQRHSLLPTGHNRQQNSMMKDKLKMAWHGVKMLLKKAERLLAGTPFQTPVAAVNVLIELGNVCPSLLFVILRLLIIDVGRCRQQGCAGRARD